MHTIQTKACIYPTMLPRARCDTKSFLNRV